MATMKIQISQSLVRLLLLLALLLTVDPKASQAAEKIRISYTAISGEQSILWIAKEAGTFERYGLDPEMIFIESSTLATQAMLAGDLHLGLLGGSGVILGSLRGSGVKIISGVINVLAQILVTDPKITRPGQLKGAKIAIARFGSLSDLSVRLALERLGVPLSDVTLVQIGAQTTRFSALQSGLVQATVVAPPLTRVAAELGFYPMLDMIKEKIDFQSSGIAASPTFLRERRETISKFMKGFVAGIHYAKTHRQESMRITAKYMKLDYEKNRPALEEGYNIFIGEVVQKKPYPTLAGIRRVLDQIAERDPKAKAVKPEQFVDTSFLQELDQSGFIDGLYK